MKREKPKKTPIVQEYPLHPVEEYCTVDSSGAIRWWLHGRRHREDGPAVIRPDGYRAWHSHGFTGREDGPAVIWPSGSKEWWVDGKLTPGEEA